MAQKEFLGALADACRAKGIHTAIETSMLIYDEDILKKMDLIMADVKVWDSAEHEKYTNVPNNKIIEHLRKADSLGIPMILRTPVVPGVLQDIPRISAFAAELKNVRQYELLPYHPLGDSKRAAMGLEPAPFVQPSKEQMKELNTYAFLR